jgi:hypothetical protein
MIHACALVCALGGSRKRLCGWLVVQAAIVVCRMPPPVLPLASASTLVCVVCCTLQEREERLHVERRRTELEARVAEVSSERQEALSSSTATLISVRREMEDALRQQKQEVRGAQGGFVGCG